MISFASSWQMIACSITNSLCNFITENHAPNYAVSSTGNPSMRMISKAFVVGQGPSFNK